jgi:hypothetical protein
VKIFAIIVTILLAFAILVIVMMMMSISAYKNSLDEFKSKNRKLRQQLQEAETRAEAVSYQETNSRIGRSDAVELQNLRRQNATLTRQLEEADRIKTSYMQLQERYRRLTEAQNAEHTVPKGNSPEDEETLTAELTRIKHSYAQLLKERSQQQDALFEAKDTIAVLRKENEQLREALETSRDSHAAVTQSLRRAEEENAKLTRQQEPAPEPAAPAAEPAAPQTEADRYLEMAKDPRKLDMAGKIRFLSAFSMMDGSVKLSGSSSARLAELAMLPDDAVIPNPYFFRRLGEDGELGSDLKKLRYVMQFPEPESLRRYHLTGLRPARAEEADGAFRLTEQGELVLS